jgi:hypothetical protein
MVTEQWVWCVAQVALCRVLPRNILESKKGKVVPFHAMKAYSGRSVTSRPGHFTPEPHSGTHWTGGWVGSKGCLEGLDRTLFSLPRIEPRTTQPVFSELYRPRYAGSTFREWLRKSRSTSDIHLLQAISMTDRLVHFWGWPPQSKFWSHYDALLSTVSTPAVMTGVCQRTEST